MWPGLILHLIMEHNSRGRYWLQSRKESQIPAGTALILGKMEFPCNVAQGCINATLPTRCHMHKVAINATFPTQYHILPLRLSKHTIPLWTSQMSHQEERKLTMA